MSKFVTEEISDSFFCFRQFLRYKLLIYEIFLIFRKNSQIIFSSKYLHV